MNNYLIWSNEHKAWWRPDWAGYTVDLGLAGQYSRDDAIKICTASRDGWGTRSIPPEIPVLEVDARECALRWKDMQP